MTVDTSKCTFTSLVAFPARQGWITQLKVCMKGDPSISMKVHIRLSIVALYASSVCIVDYSKLPPSIEGRVDKVSSPIAEGVDS